MTQTKCFDFKWSSVPTTFGFIGFFQIYIYTYTPLKAQKETKQKPNKNTKK